MITKSLLHRKYQGIKHSLNEKSRRLWCATEALAMGEGGVTMICTVTGVTPPTVYAGIRELQRKPSRKKSHQRIRKKGGGAKTMEGDCNQICEKTASFLAAVHIRCIAIWAGVS